jgi:hypothetical protein
MDSTQLLVDPRGHKYMRVQLISKIIEWSEYNKNCLDTITNLSEESIKKLQSLYDEWYEIWMLDNAVYGEIILETHTSFSMHIFVELSRTHFILEYPRIAREREQLKALMGAIPENPQDYDLLYDPNQQQKPIMSYPQSVIMSSLQEISMEIKVGGTIVGDNSTKRLLNLLYLRNSALLCSSSSINSLDLDQFREIDGDYYVPSKEYIMYTCIYFQAIFHRYFYLNEFETEPITIDWQSTKSWIETQIFPYMIGDSFGKFYEQACLEAYNFPGDEAWFKYRYPNELPYRGTIVNCIRPALSIRYTSEYRISFEVVKDTVNHFDLQGACSRNFLLLAIDQYMWSKFQLHWMDAICIDHEILEPSQEKLFGDRVPYLLEVFSLYYLYYKGKVYQSENIYQIIALWIDIVKRDYDCHVLGCHLMFD